MEDTELIVINKSDLDTEFVKNRIQEEKNSKIDKNKAERIPVQKSILLNPIFYTAAAGMVGALLVWAIVEPFVATHSGKENGVALMVMCFGMPVLIGLFISCIDGLVSRNVSKGLRAGAIGLGVGIVWAIVGGILSGIIINIVQAVCFIIFPNAIPKHPDPNDPFAGLSTALVIILMISRSSAWCFLGLGMGIGPGIAAKSRKMIFNGIIGGMLGGFLGGFIFDPISLICHSINSSSAGGVSRLVGFVALGLTTGAFVGLVENLAKDVWVTMDSGPLRGKQFVIYHNPTLIGSSPSSDIYIFKDPNVAPRHAQIVQRGSKFEIVDTSAGFGVYVNSQKIDGTKVLENLDTIIIGKSVLQFQVKEKK